MNTIAGHDPHFPGGLFAKEDDGKPKKFVVPNRKMMRKMRRSFARPVQLAMELPAGSVERALAAKAGRKRKARPAAHPINRWKVEVAALAKIKTKDMADTVHKAQGKSHLWDALSVLMSYGYDTALKIANAKQGDMERLLGRRNMLVVKSFFAQNNAWTSWTVQD